MTSAQLFLEGFARSTACPAWANNASGTFVCEDSGRVGTGRVSACRIIAGGAVRTVLRADPALAEALAPLVDGERDLPDDDFLRWSRDHGAVVLGGSLMKTLAGPVAVSERTALRMDWANGEHMALMKGFIERVDADDLDEAEIELDDLDRLAVCLLDEGGRMDAYAGARPFDEVPAFGDIGIAVFQETRRQGLGAAVLAGLINDVLVPEGVHPLYRCDVENAASDKLSAALGFETVLELLVVEVPNVR